LEFIEDAGLIHVSDDEDNAAAWGVSRGGTSRWCGHRAYGV